MLSPLVIATVKKGWGVLKDADDAEARAERVQLEVFEDTIKLIGECEAAGGDIPLRARVMVYVGLSYLMLDKTSPFAGQAGELKERLAWLSESEFNKHAGEVELTLAIAQARARIIRYRHANGAKGAEASRPEPVSLADLTPPKKPKPPKALVL
jgi:hypothetical protein